MSLNMGLIAENGELREVYRMVQASVRSCNKVYVQLHPQVCYTHTRTHTDIGKGHLLPYDCIKVWGRLEEMSSCPNCLMCLLSMWTVKSASWPLRQSKVWSHWPNTSCCLSVSLSPANKCDHLLQYFSDKDILKTTCLIFILCHLCTSKKQSIISLNKLQMLWYLHAMII